jgi:UDP:flavonoid glycosyltransferase YjiC (YdhE family)
MLFSFVGGRGHLEPLLPIAAAAQAAGHTVAFAADPWMVDAVTRAGFPTLPLPPRDPVDDEAAGASDESAAAKPLLAVDRAREESDLREKFVRDAAPPRATRFLGHAAAWQPDVIVCDEVDVGTVAAAERLAIPCATVIVLAAGGFFRQDVVGPALDELRAGLGLPADPDGERRRGDLVIDPTPPGYRDPADPILTPVIAVHLTPAATAGSTPPWTVTRPGRPALYVTLGTVFNLESGDLFQRVLAAVASHDGDVLLTVGGDLDPAALGPQPEHVHLERFVPQAAVLPHVAAVISHAGSGSVLGALGQGVPMVLLPMGADQPWNGDRCEALGVARILDPVAATPAAITTAFRDVLDEPAYRRAAERHREALAALPGPGAAVAAIDRLAAGQSA